jgi:hypothetical protein
MKKAILMLVITAAAIGTTAQTSKTKLGAHGAAISEITLVNGKAALNLGAYGGVLINHKLLIGVAGNNIFFKQTVNNKKESFQFNYYGLYSEYRFMPERKIGVAVGLTGAMGWQENDIRSFQKTSRKDGRFTFVIQPKLGLNVKVTKFMQVQAYSSYRFTGNTFSSYCSAKNYNGISGGAGLVFGSF